MSKIGVQAMMLKNDFAKFGVFETLKRVREIGYSAVELSAIPLTPPNMLEIEKARAELGMEVASISAGLTGSSGDSLTGSLDKIIDDAKRLNAREIRIGIMPREAMSSPGLVFEFCDRANEIASILAERGIRLSYHNHHIEFAKHQGRFLLDLIAERAPLLALQIDVHWAARGGVDPVTVLAKYGSRVSMVHLKDYRIGWKQGNDPGLQDQQVSEIFPVQFAEVGEGSLDFSAIIRQSLAIGARYLLVEQDEFYGRTALECLQTSYDNLVTLGYRDLF